MLGPLPDLTAFFDARRGGSHRLHHQLHQLLQRRFEIEVGSAPESFVELMKDLDLFETRTQMFTPVNPDGTQGTPQAISEYFAISEIKLKQLPADKVHELLMNGALAQIHAHLMSLLGWDRLINLALFRQSQQPRPANLN